MKRRRSAWFAVSAAGVIGLVLLGKSGGSVGWASLTKSEAQVAVFSFPQGLGQGPGKLDKM
jgi:hypothetical protein